MFEIRTDLAVEEKESFPGNGGEVGGVSLREWKTASSGIKLTEVVILDEEGARVMGKPLGTYITMEAGRLRKKDEGYHREVSEELASQLHRMVSRMKEKGELDFHGPVHVWWRGWEIRR